MPNDVRTDEWTIKTLVGELRSAQGEGARDWTEELFKQAADLIEALAAHDAKVRAEQREEVVTVVEHIADEHSVALTNQANAFDSRWEQGALGASEAILRAIRAVPANTNTDPELSDSERGN